MLGAFLCSQNKELTERKFGFLDGHIIITINFSILCSKLEVLTG